MSYSYGNRLQFVKANVGVQPGYTAQRQAAKSAAPKSRANHR